MFIETVNFDFLINKGFRQASQYINVLYLHREAGRCRWGGEVDVLMLLPHAGVEADEQVAPGEVRLHLGLGPVGLGATCLAVWWCRDDV